MDVMTDEQIAAAKARASEVVNGFRRPTERIASDAVRLAEMLEARNKQVVRLAEELSKHQGAMPSWLNDIFGGGLAR